jgi:hypothetical protein
MLKNYLPIFLFLLLTNCAAPGTALLGPAVTGATTQSLTRSSISLATNQIARKVYSSPKSSIKNKVAKKIEDFTKKKDFNKLLKLDN